MVNRGCAAGVGLPTTTHARTPRPRGPIGATRRKRTGTRRCVGAATGNGRLKARRVIVIATRHHRPVSAGAIGNARTHKRVLTNANVYARKVLRACRFVVTGDRG